jgi:hypothetical protein
MPRAARRLFFESGEEIKAEKQLKKSNIVYVSMGEEFIDPLLNTKQIIDQRKLLLWTSNGLQVLSQEDEQNMASLYRINSEKQATESDEVNEWQSLHRRERLLRTKHTKRLIVFENGSEYNSMLVVIEIIDPLIKNKLNMEEITRMERAFLNEFLLECTSRMKLFSPARIIYNWHGNRVKGIEDIPVLDQSLQAIIGEVEHAPIWISKGEGCDSKAVILFLEKFIRSARKNYNKLKKEKKVTQKNLYDLKTQRPVQHTIAIRIVELDNQLSTVLTKMDELNNSISKLNSLKSELEKTGGEEDLYKHIKPLSTTQSIFGGSASKGLKLKVYMNGTDEHYMLVYFSKKEFKELENEKSKEQNTNKSFSPKLIEPAIYELLKHITQIVHAKNRSSPALFTRLFDQSGAEVTSIKQLKYEESVWVSSGEDWKSLKNEMVLSLSIDKLILDTEKNTQNFEKGENSVSSITKKSIDKNTMIFTSSESDNEMNSDDEYEYKTITTKTNKPQTKEINMRKNKEALNLNTTIQLNYSHEGEAQGIIKELNQESIDPFYKSCYWGVTNINKIVFLSKLDQLEQDKQNNLKKSHQAIIYCKKAQDRFLYPRLAILPKKSIYKKADNQEDDDGKSKVKKVKLALFENFQYSLQIWQFDQKGFIYNRFFRNLCFTINRSISVQLKLSLKNSSKNVENQESNQTIIKGFAITLGTRNLNEMTNDINDKKQNQEWGFSSIGNIYSRAFDDKKMVMTNLRSLIKELEKNDNGVILSYSLEIIDKEDKENFLDKQELPIVLLERLDDPVTSRLTSSQRWAIKQNDFKRIGEWRFSTLATPEWHKLAYSWPVNEREELISNFEWPINGFLISDVPPLKNLEPFENEPTTKLRVLRNGSFNTKTSISLPYSEFNQFLNTCYTLLGLSTAARRLFDEKGTEHFDLSKLKHNQLVYVSCGEAWIAPEYARKEYYTKLRLAALAEDLSKINYFNSLKAESSNLVIEAQDLLLQEGYFSHFKLSYIYFCFFHSIMNIFIFLDVPLVVAQYYLNDENLALSTNLNASKSFDDDRNQEHLSKLNSMKLFRYKANKVAAQKFAYDVQTSFIYSVENPQLVLGAKSLDGNSKYVCLMGKCEDSLNQKWIFKKNRTVALKTRPDLVLSVKLPPLEKCQFDFLKNRKDTDDEHINTKNFILNQSSLVVQPFLDYGNAHQMWKLDSEGFIHAFAADDKMNIGLK